MNAPDSIIVAGGKAERLGGIDKAMLKLTSTGESLLAGVVASCPARVIVVGPTRAGISNVEWVLDQVEEGGPASGIWAGLSKVTSEYVFISAGDQLLDSETVNMICEAALGHDGAWAIRADGSGQPLCACVKSAKIRELLAPTAGVNASPIRLMSTLEMVGVPVKSGQVTDVDTWQDLVGLLKRSELMDQVTQMWLTRVGELISVDHNVVPVSELLDLTREVAHGVERKSAPLTTFMLGYAAGKSELSTEDLKALIRHISNGVLEWESVE